MTVPAAVLDSMPVRLSFSMEDRTLPTVGFELGTVASALKVSLANGAMALAMQAARLVKSFQRMSSANQTATCGPLLR